MPTQISRGAFRRRHRRCLNVAIAKGWSVAIPDHAFAGECVDVLEKPVRDYLHLIRMLARGDSSRQAITKDAAIWA